MPSGGRCSIARPAATRSAHLPYESSSSVSPTITTEKLYNAQMVDLEALEADEEVAHLRRMIERHLRWTGSDVARKILKNCSNYLPKFVKVMRRTSSASYKNANYRS